MVEWNPAYSVEIRKIDRQHRKILEIINELSSLDRGQQRETMKKVFTELLR